MRHQRTEFWGRRESLGGLTLTGTVGLLGLHPRRLGAEPPPETPRLRRSGRRRRGVTCQTAMYVAEELLRGEGFTEVQYVEAADTIEAYQALAAGDVDLGIGFAAPLILHVDAGDTMVVLAGGHVGGFELFGGDRIRALRDLKGKTVTVPWLGSPQHIYLASIVAYIGLDLHQDINWVTHPPAEAVRLFTEGTIDAFLGFPPQAQELRAKQIGHVLVNSMMDRPWSHCFCCMPVGNREFVRKHPIATKRWLRALLKATDVCAREPARVVRFLMDKGYTEDYEYTLQALQEIPYDKWREYDPEDTVRFYALRLHEAGMITSTPQKIISQGTDWRFLNHRQLKPSSVNRQLATLKSFLTWAAAAGLLPAWPTPALPKTVRQERHGPRWLDRREQYALRRAVERGGRVRDIAMVTLLLNTGLRLQELCALT